MSEEQTERKILRLNPKDRSIDELKDNEASMTFVMDYDGLGTARPGFNGTVKKFVGCHEEATGVPRIIFLTGTERDEEFGKFIVDKFATFKKGDVFTIRRIPKKTKTAMTAIVYRIAKKTALNPAVEHLIKFAKDEKYTPEQARTLCDESECNDDETEAVLAALKE